VQFPRDPAPLLLFGVDELLEQLAASLLRSLALRDLGGQRPVRALQIGGALGDTPLQFPVGLLQGAPRRLDLLGPFLLAERRPQELLVGLAELRGHLLQPAHRFRLRSAARPPIQLAHILSRGSRELG
jgi:hypothetical protein